MAKLIRSLSAVPFASRIAWRNEPAPPSLTLVTVSVAPEDAAATARPAAKARILPAVCRVVAMSVSCTQRAETGRKRSRKHPCDEEDDASPFADAGPSPGAIGHGSARAHALQCGLCGS